MRGLSPLTPGQFSGGPGRPATKIPLVSSSSNTLSLDGRTYRVVAILKEDRYARSTLLEGARGRRFVLKESVMRLPPGVRVPPLAGLLARHEAGLYERLAGLPGIPRLTARPRPDAFLREFVEGETVRDTARVP